MLRTYNHYSKNDIYLHKSTGLMSSRVDGYPTESHPRVELNYVLSGKVTYIIDGRLYHVQPGDLVVVGAHELHSLKIDSSIPYERIGVQFPPKIIPVIEDLDLDSAFSKAYLYQHIIPNELMKKSKIPRLMNKLISCIKLKAPYKETAILSALINLIAEIHKTSNMLFSTKNSLMRPASKKVSDLLNQIIEYVNGNLTTPLTAESTSQALGISTDYLYHFFKGQMGISFREYVENQKMKLASILLQQGYTAQNAADYLGYEYYKTFYLQYKRVFKASPSQHSHEKFKW